jgi:drug/metabolite transporter (DMT)-like permease
MYIPHTVVHARRSGGKKPNPRQQWAAVVAAAFSAIAAAMVSAGAKRGLRMDSVVVGLVFVVGAAIAGVMIARTNGRRHKV